MTLSGKTYIVDRLNDALAEREYNERNSSSPTFPSPFVRPPLELGPWPPDWDSDPDTLAVAGRGLGRLAPGRIPLVLRGDERAVLRDANQVPGVRRVLLRNGSQLFMFPHVAGKTYHITIWRYRDPKNICLVVEGAPGFSLSGRIVFEVTPDRLSIVEGNVHELASADGLPRIVWAAL